MRIKSGDNVIVISGKDKGRTGKVIRSLPRENKVIVEGVNIKKKHQQARRGGQKGQIIDKALPIHVSNVMLVDPKTGKRTRVGVEVEGGSKRRVAKKSGTIL
jgi:large subunit ribosomal protein L24